MGQRIKIEGLTRLFLQQLEQVWSVLLEQLLQWDFTLKKETVPQVFHGSDGIKPKNESLLADLFKTKISYLTECPEEGNSLCLSQCFHFYKLLDACSEHLFF
jgi:hypothetical protein